MTVPAAAALMGVPLDAPMSMPGWNEQSPFGRQRGPYGLLIGPLTGQTRPDADGVPDEPDVDPDADGPLSAARIRSASAALTATSLRASSANTFSFTLIDDSVARFELTAVSSCCCVETSCCVPDCCSSVGAR